MIFWEFCKNRGGWKKVLLLHCCWAFRECGCIINSSDEDACLASALILIGVVAGNGIVQLRVLVIFVLLRRNPTVTKVTLLFCQEVWLRINNEQFRINIWPSNNSRYGTTSEAHNRSSVSLHYGMPSTRQKWILNCIQGVWRLNGMFGSSQLRTRISKELRSKLIRWMIASSAFILNLEHIWDYRYTKRIRRQFSAFKSNPLQ